MRFILTSALLAGLAMAAPAPVPAVQANNTATCTIEYGSMKGTWTVLVGRPYINGAGCAYVKKAVRKGLNTMSSHPGFVCEDDGNGMTRLQFTTVLATNMVNKGLQIAYPMIPFEQNSICPPYSLL